MNGIRYKKFATDETPHCLWDFDHATRNLEFFDSIDGGYFQHIADIHSGYLDGEEKQYAATALRVAYSHGLESLFALLCAVAQSPDCIVGWMIKYKNAELDRVVGKIQNSEPIKTKLNVERVTWKVLADIIFQHFKTGDEEFDLQTRKAFAEAWRRFAVDHLEETHGIEYNNIKHGLRARAGGIFFAMSRLPHKQGEPPATDDMIVASNSVFGSSFLVPEKLHDNRNFALKRQGVNWKPQKFITALELISMSIKNVITTLKALYGAEPTGLQFSYFENLDDYNEPWKHEDHFKLAMNSNIEESYITPFSKEEILSVYDKREDK